MKNLKRMLLTLTLSVGLLLPSVPAMAAPQPTSIKINDKTVQYTLGAPINDKGTTLVPLRSTLNAMDMKLTTATDDMITAVINGKTITLKSKLTLINGVTYAPIRIVGDATGYDVQWDAATRTVLLVSKGEETETAHSEGRGFMWEVDSNGNTVYLVGSIHVADDSFYPLRKEYEDAFAKADYLGVEIDVSKMNDKEHTKLFQNTQLYQDGTTLKDHIPSEMYTQLAGILKQHGLEPNVMDVFKPWAVDLYVQSFKNINAGYTGSEGIDLYFVKKAYERNMPVIELESYEFQLKTFDSFSKRLQLKNLQMTMDNINTLEDSINTMAETWKTGNDEQLLEITNSIAYDEEYYKAIIIDRNVNMTEKIEGYLKNGKGEDYFIVVGAGHFLGDHGVIKLLEDKGYTVERK